MSTRRRNDSTTTTAAQNQTQTNHAHQKLIPSGIKLTSITKAVQQLPSCKHERERVRRAYFGYKFSGKAGKPLARKHNDRFTARPCRSK